MPIDINLVSSFQMGTIQPEQADRIYEMLLNLWKDRDVDEAQERYVVESYRRNFFREDRRFVAEAIVDICRGHEPKPARVLEMGCANAPLLHFFKEVAPEVPVEFVGIEPYKPFIADVNELFPEATMIDATAEQFAEFTPADCPPPFRLFTATVALCMMHPRVAQACISKAAELCDEILLYDFVVNTMGGISATEPVAFIWKPEIKQFYFAHCFESYFQACGFRLVDIQPRVHESGKHGFGMIRAVRAD